MDWQLTVFVTVVEEQSFTRAAEKLHISQLTISQHIQTLEQRLDVRLLDRERRRVRLNPAARSYIDMQRKSSLCTTAWSACSNRPKRSRPAHCVSAPASHTENMYSRM
ncbi:LysR family transcriptional regulator [Alicyclobacillus sacchari]|uniref:LysR family transcriptional regulator n=1 Tax=Alicyclobacillus sacchari TaxID=392010 RepID=UPI0024E18BE5|nr:LysR family transcriptional regulator [Alicyclobacillus sacchari]